MKMLISLLFVILFAVSLTACTRMTAEEKAHIKCPQCGFEFEMPVRTR